MLRKEQGPKIRVNHLIWDNGLAGNIFSILSHRVAGLLGTRFTAFSTISSISTHFSSICQSQEVVSGPQ